MEHSKGDSNRWPFLWLSVDIMPYLDASDFPEHSSAHIGSVCQVREKE